MRELKKIKYWLFDLDNTLYSGATKVFEQNGFIKVEIALSKGKKNFDKRSKMTEKRVKKEIRNYK